LNVTAIFTRRIRLSKGIAWVVLGIALGKTLGAW
ncbi:MAG: stage V sporulation protein AB, partial [Lachnospiraceae bacterium]|nr:stage V sporulation protein AB [Lachnospiraceae bacterium]